MNSTTLWRLEDCPYSICLFGCYYKATINKCYLTHDDSTKSVKELGKVVLNKKLLICENKTTKRHLSASVIRFLGIFFTILIIIASHNLNALISRAHSIHFSFTIAEYVLDMVKLVMKAFLNTIEIKCTLVIVMWISCL